MTQPSSARAAGLRLYRLLPSVLTAPIVHLVTPSFTMGAIAVIEYGDRILALRQLHRRGLSLPGGLVDRGETPQQAVVREVMEETGLQVTSGAVYAVSVATRRRQVDVIFRIVCEKEPVIRPASEATSYEWVDPSTWDPELADKSTRRILKALHAAYGDAGPGRVLTE
ncbi:NUDIX hydrolase [Branchiibius cervicis]|uniref:NUDIX hydrolase n=1 Tax=Branchiibius cervicis TaxID=908252 RepID=A0ABW2AXU1_9MICO